MKFSQRSLFPWVLLLAFWLLLYLPHLRTSPGWYGDETLIHHTSLNLVRGMPTNFALWNTFWHPHYPYQPAYTWINGVFGHLAGGDLVGARFFNTLLALASAAAIYGLGQRSFGKRAALFAAAMFLAYGQSIIHFRMSYAHNAAGFGLLLMTLFLLRRASSVNDWRAGVGLLIAAGSHPLFVHGALAGGLCRLLRPRSWIPLFLPAAIGLAVSMAFIYFALGGWLIEDLVHLKNVFTDRGEQDGGGLQAFRNFSFFVFQDWFHVGMVAGLLLCLPLRRFAAPIVGLLVLFLLVRNRQNLVVFYYQAVVVLPVLALGWAGMWKFLETRIRRFVPRFRWLVWSFACLPVLLFVTHIPDSLRGGITPRNHYWVTQSPAEVEAAARWLNERTGPDDTLGGNPNIAWLLDAETIPYLQMITWYGLPTQGYENLNKRERFRFDASLENIRFAVVGDIDQRWTFGEPNVNILAKQMEEEAWPLVWQGENTLIFENPRHSGSDR